MNPIQSRARIPSRLISVVIALAAILAWEAMSRAGSISPFLAPAPSAVVEALFALFVTGEILPHLLATLYRVFAGLFIGGVAGGVLGLLMGAIPRLREIADPFVAAVHPLPKIAILPLFMALLGIGDASRIAVISLGVFFPMMINTMSGVSQINQTHLDVARNYGAGGAKLLTRVLLPASLPMMLSGLRIGMNLALLFTITTEIAGATVGLGALMWMSWEVLRLENLYAVLVVIMVLGLTCNMAMKFLTQALTPWSPAEERTSSQSTLASQSLIASLKDNG